MKKLTILASQWLKTLPEEHRNDKTLGIIKSYLDFVWKNKEKDLTIL